MNRGGILAAAVVACLAGCSRPRPLVVGAQSSTEQTIVGEAVAQHLERRLRVPVGRKLNLGGTLLAHQAMMTGIVDLYPEYSGVALSVILKVPHESDPSITLERVRNEYRIRSAVEWQDPLGYSGGPAMIVRAADARAARLETLTDATGYAPRWVLGVTQEFLEQPAFFRRLLSTYALPLAAAPKMMAPGALYTALVKNEVSMVAGSPTDAALAGPNFKVLQDDRGAFPPCQAALAVRADALSRHPGLRQALAQLEGKFSTEGLRKLAYEVEVRRRPVAEVAGGFLRQARLVP